jgi:hypothetical protein
LLLKETIHGNISWSNASIDDNMTISLIVNAKCFIFFNKDPMKVPLSFETSNQAIMDISKDIDATTNKFQTQKWKKLEAKPKKMKANVKATRKEIMKKGLQS